MGWTSGDTDDRLSVRDVRYDDGARSNGHSGPDPDSGHDRDADPEHRVRANSNVPGEVCSRGDVGVRPDNAVVVDGRRRVDDGAVPYPGEGADDRSAENSGTCADCGRAGDLRTARHEHVRDETEPDRVPLAAFPEYRVAERDEDVPMT